MDRFDEDGRLNDESFADEVREIVDELLAQLIPRTHESAA